MHRAIAVWLTARPWRAAVASAFCGALAPQMPVPFMVLAGAIPVLMALRFEAKLALAIAATAAAAAVWVVLSVAAKAHWIALGMLVLVMGPVLLALLLRSTRSLNLCFQVAVLCSAVVLLIVYAALPDPEVVWVPALKTVLDSMAAAGMPIEGDVGAKALLLARTMWGAVVALTLGMVMGSLFLGGWWQSLLQTPGSFGAEYRRLRLGRVLGIGVTVLFLAALLGNSGLVASLALVAFTALSFQGLAAAHRSKAGGKLNRGWLAAIYVALIVPLSTSITVFVLALWGFADNWLRPQARSV